MPVVFNNGPTMIKRSLKSILPTASLIAGLALLPAAALAHPHVFVTVEATVGFENGAITGIHHVWTFDEFYSAMAVEGLDTNKDGKFSRDELAELAKVNLEGLKEFQYFTFATLAGKELKLADPKPDSAWLVHAKDVLSLHFHVPLATPVLPEAKGFAFSIYDQSYFIALELASKDDAVKLGDGAPKSCKLTVGIPKQEGADAKKLSDAFAQQLGGGAATSGPGKTISVNCT
jgi:ABC-type uncharacterized transport system substrate-binding protein